MWVESGAPAERPRENARLGVTRRDLPGRALAEERTVGGDVPFLPEDLADINAEAGDRGTDVEAGKEFPEPHAEFRVHGKNLVGVYPDHKVI